MSKFVNYKKRAFTLPPGCKDLIDVLAPSRRRREAYMATGGLPPLAGIRRQGEWHDLFDHEIHKFFVEWDDRV